MTAKRFRVTISNTNVVSFVDVVENKQLMSITFKNKSDAMDCKNALMYQCDLLNELHEENNLLKDIIKDIVVQLDANHTSHTYQMTIPINKVIYNELKRRLEETSFNEELRRFLE